MVSNLKKSGFKESTNEKFNFLWTYTCKPEQIRDISYRQRINHFPNSYQLGRKDMMYRNFNNMKRRLGAGFDYCPMTYILPQDYTRFKLDQKEEPNPKQLWIVKPTNEACGRGIKVIQGKQYVKNKENHLISRYVMNPHLINGFKYDIRL